MSCLQFAFCKLPRFLTPVSGCFVATNPNVMNRPASLGHDFRIGKSSNDASVDVISVTGPMFLL